MGMNTIFIVKFLCWKTWSSVLTCL